MSGRIGRALGVQIFGESHGPMVGATVDGFPAGFRVHVEELTAFLQFIRLVIEQEDRSGSFGSFHQCFQRKTVEIGTIVTPHNLEAISQRYH